MVIGWTRPGSAPDDSEHGLRELEPAHVTLVRDVEEPRPGGRRRGAGGRGRRVVGEHRVAALVTPRSAGSRARPASRRIVLTMLLPCCPHTHEIRTIVASGDRRFVLAGELGASVGRLRVRLVPLDVRRRLRAVEHVVGREVHRVARRPRAAASATWRLEVILLAAHARGRLRTRRPPSRRRRGRSTSGREPSGCDGQALRRGR